MAYWWVSQNKTYSEERAGEFLWAPKRTKKGGPPRHYWTAMTLVRPGDIVFSIVQKHVRAVSVARAAAYDAPQPNELEITELWSKDGWRVELAYEDMIPPVPTSNFLEEL